MMPRHLNFALALLSLSALGALTGCSSDVERTFGLTRDAPDEFTVTTRAPLSQPPDYTLTPPRPGATRPQELTAQQSAEAALAPDTALTTPSGPGQRRPGGAGRRCRPRSTRRYPRPHQRRTAARRAAPGPDREADVSGTPNPTPGTLLDPSRESQRLRENAALGQPATVGDTPIIQPKKQSSFLGIF